MKTKIIHSIMMSFLFVCSFAQDRTTVNASSSEISDNLDLRAVASIFGDSRDLEDFENRLNNPENQISNLDLNYDNQVDYLRVIETIEGNTHLIVLQSVLGKDTYQDVATVEVEKDLNNTIQVQVVGDVFMYGNNYIYEPVYVSRPIIYNHFWTPNYRPYFSNWYWNYYPSYYTYWTPFPIFRYRNHIAVHININHQYNYVNTRRCQIAYNNYYVNRANYYERQNPDRSFANRNSGYTNRYELDRSRITRTTDSVRNNNIYESNRNSNTRNTNSGNQGNTVSRNSENNSTRSNSSRANTSVRNRETLPQQSSSRNEGTRASSSSRNPQVGNRSSSTRNENIRVNNSNRNTESTNRSGTSSRR